MSLHSELQEEACAIWQYGSLFVTSHTFDRPIYIYLLLETFCNNHDNVHAFTSQLVLNHSVIILC